MAVFHDAVGFDLGVGFFVAVGPGDGEFVDGGGGAEAEVEIELVLGEVGGVGTDLGGLGEVAGFYGDAGTEGIGVAAGLAQFYGDPVLVVFGGVFEEEGFAGVGEDGEIDEAILVIVGPGPATTDQGIFKGGTGGGSDVEEAAIGF